jgi:hypothetical protein
MGNLQAEDGKDDEQEMPKVEEVGNAQGKA